MLEKRVMELLARWTEFSKDAEFIIISYTKVQLFSYSADPEIPTLL